MGKILIMLLSCTLTSKAQIQKTLLDFEFDGVRLSGVLNVPDSTIPLGVVLIVHGSGQTKAVEQEWHYDVREQLVKSGYAVYMYDKMGCGQSGGTFDYHQSVQNSAQEVIAAIQALKNRKIPGSDVIGLWGISRAGWVCPLVINEYKDIDFWISVSGVDEKENFKYLLAKNLKINGLPKDTIDLMIEEWVEGTKICHSGGSFESYEGATLNLRKNPFYVRFTNGGSSEAGYYTYQKSFAKEKIDAKTGLQLYVNDFETVLSAIRCPVLALFGEKDMNVDWVKTKALYEKTLGRNADLTINSFPDGNHNLVTCETGGFYEVQDNDLPWERCHGFLETMADWLAHKE